MTVMTTDLIPRQRAAVAAARTEVSPVPIEPRSVGWLRWLLIALAAAFVGGIVKEFLFDLLGDPGSSAPILALTVLVALGGRR